MIPYDNYLDRSGYRLPSEAEWEYACRAGTATRYHCGKNVDTLRHYAWFHENANDVLRATGLLKPNDFGLFDMHGGVWEFCYESADALERIIAKGQPCVDEEDLSRLNDYVPRVSRGGSYYDRPTNARYFVRLDSAPHMVRSGIRLTRTLPSSDVNFQDLAKVQAYQPYPGNSEKNISPHTQRLRWASTSSSQTHSVHFGQDAQALKHLGSVSASPDCEFDLPDLEAEKKYF